MPFMLVIQFRVFMKLNRDKSGSFRWNERSITYPAIIGNVRVPCIVEINLKSGVCHWDWQSFSDKSQFSAPRVRTRWFSIVTFHWNEEKKSQSEIKSQNSIYSVIRFIVGLMVCNTRPRVATGSLSNTFRPFFQSCFFFRKKFVFFPFNRHGPCFFLPFRFPFTREKNVVMIGFIVCRIQAHSIDWRVCQSDLSQNGFCYWKNLRRMTQKYKVEAQRKWIPLNYHSHRKSSLSCMDTNTRFAISDWRFKCWTFAKATSTALSTLLRSNPQCNEHIINSLGLCFGFFSPELWITSGTVIFHLKSTVAMESDVEKNASDRKKKKKIIVWTTIFTVWMVSVLSKWKCIGNWWLNVFPHTYSFGRTPTNAAIIPSHTPSLRLCRFHSVSFWNRSIGLLPQKIEAIKGKSQNVIRSR